MIEPGKLMGLIEKARTLRGLAVFCRFSTDQYGQIVVPVFASDFPIHHLKLLIESSFDLIALDPFVFPMQKFEVLPICNQNSLLQGKLFTELMNSGKGSLRKIPWRTKEKEKEELDNLKLLSDKSHLEELFSKDEDNSISD